jgi:hypothetical protein
MTPTFRSDPADPSPSRWGAGTLAVSIAAALLTGLLLLAQTTPSGTPAATLLTDPAPSPHGKEPVSPPSPALDAGVDWSRVERVQAPAGDSVAAYGP